MLELRDIKKTYRVGDIETTALKGVSMTFREKEFVAILGTSGSGKTTCLNIIGGLDRYDSGELIIKGKDTSGFSEKDWDAYRNNSVGFVFQSYNLISHLSIVANVELGMTLSGIGKEEKRRRALEVLERVGLGEHLHKKPTQLSGGQMQRVAIARALANDPEVLLCDEPTGALDKATSLQIMDLIKSIASDRLVIMVTHNPALAEKYANRTVNLEDGLIISDSNPYTEEDRGASFSLKHTVMRFTTALSLSFNNLKTKKARTALTAFASSIGIIGIAMILSLSNGFQIQIDEFQATALSEFPIIIMQEAMNTGEDGAHPREGFQRSGTEPYAQSDRVYIYDPKEYIKPHFNKFSDEYIEYLRAIDPEVCSSIGMMRLVNMNLLRKEGGSVVPASFSMDMGMSMSGSSFMAGMSNAGLSSYPVRLKDDAPSYLEDNYDLLAGAYPGSETDLVLVVDHRNRLDEATLALLGYETEGVETMPFADFLGAEFIAVGNDNYYRETGFGIFMPGQDYASMAEKEGNLTLRISGVVRPKESNSISLLRNGIAYSDNLAQRIIDMSINSEIVLAQRESDYFVMDPTMTPFKTESDRFMYLSFLGGEATPYALMLYPTSFEGQSELTAYLDAFNDTREDPADKVFYTDLAGSITGMTKGIMDGVTVVLIAFASISLIVSLLMISIITYTSVIERTKEIGVLRSLGARKKDITRVFDAETTIIGVLSGLLGLTIALLATLPANAVIEHLTGLENVARLQISHLAALLALSTALTVLGGHIPARMASKKDAVEALRSE